MIAASLQVGANAQVVDFEDLSGGSNFGSYISYGDTITSDGFMFVSQGGSNDTFGSFTPSSPYYTGTTAVYTQTNNNPLLVMTRVGGGTFNVSSIGLADIDLGNTVQTVTFTPNVGSAQTIVMTNPTSITDYALSFTGITSLQFSAGSNYLYQIDNIHVPSGTPEPFTMGLGIAGIGLAVRRRMKAKTDT